YLQQGRYRKAEELLVLMKKTMSESTYDNKLRPNYYEDNYANMAAAFVVETERWNLARTLFPAGSPVVMGQTAAAGRDMQSMPGAHSGHGGNGVTPLTTSDGSATVRASNRSQALPLFIRGLADAVIGSREVETSLTGLKAISGGVPRGNAVLEIRQLEIAALDASMKKDHTRATELMKNAIALEEELGPPSGPPNLIKPSYELFGEVLLRAGKPEAALEQFKATLLRQPN